MLFETDLCARTDKNYSKVLMNYLGEIGEI